MAGSRTVIVVDKLNYMQLPPSERYYDNAESPLQFGAEAVGAGGDSEQAERGAGAQHDTAGDARPELVQQSS